MLGSDDLRPERQPRASDPSLEEMLRRARDARLGGDLGTTGVDAPRFTPFSTEHRTALGAQVRNCAVLVLGALLGALIACSAVRIGTLTGAALTLAPTTAQTAADASPPTPVVPTDTPFPTATDTPVPTPTPTDVPTATATPDPTPTLTTDEITSLVADYYDNRSAFAGEKVLVDVIAIQIQQQDAAQLTACITYEYAAATSPGVVAGSKTQPFTLEPDPLNNGTWRAVGMGYPDSCSLS